MEEEMKKVIKAGLKEVVAEFVSDTHYKLGYPEYKSHTITFEEFLEWLKINK